jgi:hypothetical protein
MSVFATSALRACPGLRSKDRGKPGRREQERKTRKTRQGRQDKKDSNQVCQVKLIPLPRFAQVCDRRPRRGLRSNGLRSKVRAKNEQGLRSNGPEGGMSGGPEVKSF